MTDANYIKHMKVIGKLAYCWDQAGDTLATMEAYIAALFDQVFTGAGASYDAGLLLAGFHGSLDQAINAGASGETTRKAMLAHVCSQYLVNALFTNDLTTTPTASTATAACEALQFDLVADSKTLTDVAATGIVNFLETAFAPISGPTGGWETEADATADYKDTVYCILAQV